MNNNYSVAFLTVKSLLVFLPTVLAAISLLSCKDNNEEPEPAGDYSAVVEFSFMAECDDALMNNVAVTIFDEASATQESVELNKEYTKSITFDELPVTSGFVIEPSVKADVPVGTEIPVKYLVDCKVTLKCGDKVVDYLPVQQEDEMTLVVSRDMDMTDGYVFNITEAGITRADYSDYIKDDEEEIKSEVLPDNDTRSLMAAGTLYYITAPGEEIDEECLHDNLIARFAKRQKWNLDVLGNGDFLYIRGSEFDWVSASVLGESLRNGCKIILDELSIPEELDYFCDTYGIYNPLHGENEDISHSIVILADSHINMASSDETNIRGVFFLLSPADGEGGYISDYAQGQVMDDAIARLNTMSGTQSARSDISRAATDELASLIGAYKVYLNLNQTLKSSDYHSADKAGASSRQTNVYSVEYDIYNVFSIAEKRNYYYVHQEFLGNFRPCFKNVYSKAIETGALDTNSMAKICEWYADEVTLKTTPYNVAGMQIHRNSPETTTTSTTYSSGISWNLGGSVGYQAGAVKGDLSTGCSVSQSQSYSKEDVEIANNCVPGQQLEWTYTFKRATTSFNPFYVAGTSMHEGAASGRNSYKAGMDYIVSFPEHTEAPWLMGELYVMLRTTAGKAGVRCAEDTKGMTTNIWIELPFFTSADFEQQ